MSSDKRLILFSVVTIASIVGVQYVMEVTGLAPPPPPPAAKPAAPKAGAEVAKAAPATPESAAAKAADPAKTPAGVEADKPTVAAGPTPAATATATAAKPKAEFPVLGSTERAGPDGYRWALQLDSRGAGVVSASSNLYEAEYVEGKPKHQPLKLLTSRPDEPRSMSLNLVLPRDASVDESAAATAGLDPASTTELALDSVVWDVVRDAEGRAVRPVTRAAPPAPAAEPTGKPGATLGQQVAFRTTAARLGLTVTKTFRLYPGEDGFEVDLKFESPEKANSVVYKLLGPHGIPIEGEWYTGTFRDAVFGQAEGAGTKVVTLSAYDIAKKGAATRERFQTLPLRYAGVENQYFATLFEPSPAPATPDQRWDAETSPLILFDDVESRQKSDVAVEVLSKPVAVGPNLPVTHTYKVFAGPKLVEALRPFAAEDLAAYRKNQWIPFAPFFARAIISPLLDSTYDLTRYVSRAAGGKTGNYGVAIILLTLLVRLAMFPLGRKQAISAKKMQDLQPYMKEIQEKYKDDKETATKETWALYKRHKVNPVAGCLPALIQMPIFVGLWQALNNSVHLRHASFLYIQNLAAPDMLFKFPYPIPFVGSFLGDYFNLLPFVVVALMLVQTSLFAPPATTPEAEAQQKMMKYMMVFMAFMFYKVPSGLGLYFITSSLWQICERLLLPKITKSKGITAAGPDGDGPPPGGNGNGGGNGNNGGGRGGSGLAPAKPPGRFSQFWEKLLEEANKNPTYRNLADEKSRDGADRDRGGRDRDKGKPRAKPGRRR